MLNSNWALSQVLCRDCFFEPQHHSIAWRHMLVPFCSWGAREVITFQVQRMLFVLEASGDFRDHRALQIFLGLQKPLWGQEGIYGSSSPHFSCPLLGRIMIAFSLNILIPRTCDCIAYKTKKKKKKLDRYD